MFAGLERQAQKVIERLGNIRQGDAILRAFRPCEACHHRTHVQLQRVGEHRFLTGQTPQALSFGVSLYQRHCFIRTA